LDTPHWKDSRTHKNAAKELLALMQSTGLKISNLNANDCRLLANDNCADPRPLSTDDSVRELVLNWHLHLLDMASELNSPPLCFAVGALPEGLKADEASEQLKRHIEPLVKKAESLKQPLGIEFEPEHFVNTWAKLKPYLLEFKSDYFGVNFDIGHAACAGEDIVITLKDAQSFVNNMHFEDIKDGVHYHLVPGNGNLPLDDVLNYLRDIEYKKGLTVELYNHSHRAFAAIDETKAWFNERSLL
jgi:protein FrlC